MPSIQEHSQHALHHGWILLIKFIFCCIFPFDSETMPSSQAHSIHALHRGWILFNKLIFCCIFTHPFPCRSLHEDYAPLGMGFDFLLWGYNAAPHGNPENIKNPCGSTDFRINSAILQMWGGHNLGQSLPRHGPDFVQGLYWRRWKCTYRWHEVFSEYEVGACLYGFVGADAIYLDSTHCNPK